MDIVAQIIGIVAMFFNVLSYQQRKGKGVIALQLFGGLLFAINFFMLGAFGGGLLNVLAVIRAILFLNREKFKMDRIWWLWIFFAAYVGSYVMTFAVFGKAPTALNFAMECLPVVGLMLTTIAFRYSDAAIMRRYGFVCSIAWLIYNISVMSIGAICCEGFNLVSIVIGYFRLDRKNKTVEEMSK